MTASESLGSLLRFPRVRPPVSRAAISTICMESLLDMGLEMVDTGIATSPWDTANSISLVPMILRYDFVVTQMFVQNGSAVSGNFDMGVFNEAGTSKLLSTGQTAQSGINSTQVVDVTDTVLPGRARYWLAFGLDNTTGTTIRANPVAIYEEFLGIKGMANGLSSGVLVSSLSFGTPLTDIPVMGILGSAFA